jgi:ABC-type uncharacterized transport system ATPase subunit
VTIFLTTQYLDEADRLADTIALLDRGVLVATGTAEELKSSVGAESTLDALLWSGCPYVAVSIIGILWSRSAFLRLPTR